MLHARARSAKGVSAVLADVRPKPDDGRIYWVAVTFLGFGVLIGWLIWGPT